MINTGAVHPRFIHPETAVPVSIVFRKLDSQLWLPESQEMRRTILTVKPGVFNTYNID
jgi:hypothetical protein